MSLFSVSFAISSSKALGHRSITSTMAYVGTTDGQAAEAAQAALMNLF
jgi:hypothetical protein